MNVGAAKERLLCYTQYIFLLHTASPTQQSTLSLKQIFGIDDALCVRLV